MSLSDAALMIAEPEVGECRQAIANAFYQEFEMDESAKAWVIAALNGSVDAALKVLNDAFDGHWWISSCFKGYGYWYVAIEGGLIGMEPNYTAFTLSRCILAVMCKARELTQCRSEPA